MAGLLDFLLFQLKPNLIAPRLLGVRNPGGQFQNCEPQRDFCGLSPPSCFLGCAGVWRFRAISETFEPKLRSLIRRPLEGQPLGPLRLSKGGLLKESPALKR